MEEFMRIHGRKSCRTSLEIYFPLQLFGRLSLQYHMYHSNTYYPHFSFCGVKNLEFWLNEDEEMGGVAVKQQIVRVKWLLFIIASTITTHELDAFFKASRKCEFQKGTGGY